MAVGPLKEAEGLIISSLKKKEACFDNHALRERERHTHTRTRTRTHTHTLKVPAEESRTSVSHRDALTHSPGICVQCVENKSLLDIDFIQS